MRVFYTHKEIPDLHLPTASKNPVLIDDTTHTSNELAFKTALITVKISRRLGIFGYLKEHSEGLAYADQHDNLVFDAPVLSSLAGEEIRFLRGWKQYDGCVKGFNALGLLGEHVLKTMQKLREGSSEELATSRREFLLSRKSKGSNGKTIFSEESVRNFKAAELDSIDILDLSLWLAFATKPVVCSTSSNMGISLHQALRALQNTKFNVAGTEATILNDDEGWLIIWCPDEQADFMNSEKTETLRRIEAEQPPLTALHTYINRKQRDPGALRDALVDGGYFFPTNPQSKDELQNLLFVSLSEIAKERGSSFYDMVRDPKIQQTLLSLGCETGEKKVAVREGVEGGLYGLMVPYLIMLEECIQRGDADQLSTWNQASIGAALAAAVLADVVLRDYAALSADLRAEYESLFPESGRFLNSKKLGKDLPTKIHGVFDIANLQSLAQLLGVVVERHISGRGTALVGLGSSSYANGNRCYEILKDSYVSEGPFKGKSTFHPMTHTLVPVAQALVYAEDFHRTIQSSQNRSLNNDQRVQLIRDHAVKPEPAGAAAMASYLLKRLDEETLSLVEIAYSLKLLGFDRSRFLQMSGFQPDESSKFIQEAFEEGPYMGHFAHQFLMALTWDTKTLRACALEERKTSRQKYQKKRIDPEFPVGSRNATLIYLTGDNTRQPSEKFVAELYGAYIENASAILAEGFQATSSTNVNRQR